MIGWFLGLAICLVVLIVSFAGLLIETVLDPRPLGLTIIIMYVAYLLRRPST
jgi:hypothetical protein